MNESFTSIDQILDFAISNEQEAADFYQNMAAKATTPEMKKSFENFAQEERIHKNILIKIKDGQKFYNEDSSNSKKVEDLKISDYMVEAKLSNDMSYEDALVVVMQNEKAAFRLYSDLASKATNPEMKEVFSSLARQEANHKIRFETEYDELFLKEN